MASTSNDENSVNRSSSKEAVVVCHFVVKNICSGNERAVADLKVDLLTHEHGLLSLVKIVFQHGLKELCHCRDFSYESHLWDLSFAGIHYKNGWRTHNYMGGGMVMTKHHLDEQEPRILDQLAAPLEKGQRGRFAGQSGTFDFVVESLTSFDNKDKSVEENDYPKVQQVTYSFSSKLDSDFLSDEQKAVAMRLRRDYHTYFAGNNEWRRCREDGNYYAEKPLSPRWSHEEEELLCLLLNADCKFKKSWNSILQYALVSRPETASSGQWYKLRKETYRREYIGRHLSKADLIIKAKRLCLTLLENHIQHGVPKLGPRPPDRYERQLLARCTDSDYDSETASPETKRQKVEELKQRAKQNPTNTADAPVGFF